MIVCNACGCRSLVLHHDVEEYFCENCGYVESQYLSAEEVAELVGKELLKDLRRIKL